jgi:hypothetical protein
VEPFNPKSPRRVRRFAPYITVLCVAWVKSAQAQNTSLEPELVPLQPTPNVTVDRPSSESERPGARRRDHISAGALVGVGFPRPLAIEGALKLERTLLLGGEYSALPTINVAGVSVSCWAVAGDVRLFPLRGPFFVGLRAGEQHIAASATVSAYGYSVPASLSVDTAFINPRLGFLWTWDPGVSLGIDAGVQIPLSSSAASAVPKATSPVVGAAEVSAQGSVDDAANAIGQTTLPTIDLLRVGVLF